MPFITTPERIGHERGLEDGMRSGLLKAIQLSLKQHYGADGAVLLPAVQAIKDPARLEDVLTRIIARAPIAEIQELIAKT